MKKNKNHRLGQETKRSIIIILLFVFSLICAFSLFNLAGVVGTIINSILLHIFGWSRYIFPLIIFLVAYFIHKEKVQHVGALTYIGVLLFVISLSGLLHIGLEPEHAYKAIAVGDGGGYIGWVIVLISRGLMGFWVSLILLIAFLMISLLLVLNTSLSQLFTKVMPIKSMRRKKCCRI